MTEASHQSAKILIVDDEVPNLRLLELFLKHGGYNSYLSLNDSRQVLSAYQEFQPDLVLMDLMMPHLSGVAVMEQLRPLTEGTYLPVVVLTGDVSPKSRRRALAAGAKDFLTKPLDGAEVLLRIRNLLETRFLYQRLQRRADRRIQEQAALLDQANDAIMVRDRADRIVFWNQGAERLYGWSAAEAVGRVAGELLYKGPSPDLAEAIRRVVAGGSWEGELRQVTRGGRPIVVASRWTLVRDEEGRPTSQLVINTDVTDKKQLETQLAQAQRLEAVGLLAGGVAHDFNNLLTVILGYSEVALRSLGQAGPARELIQEVRKAGVRAAALTRQLLAFSRRQVLAPVVLDLNALVSETERMLRRLIGEDIALVTTLDPGLGPVKADPGQLEQVLMNLTVNARDAMPTGGRLTIETWNVERGPSASPHPKGLRGPCVLLAVTDTGCGMDEATKARVFEPFFTTKELGKGTGLGLATVYGIVEQSGGTIEVWSEPGRGASFNVYLPRLAQETVRSRGSHPGGSSPPAGTGTVLLVEDEESLRSLGGLALRSAGYTVLEARDGQEALQVCRADAGQIDLLVTDVVMPRMNGRQLADNLARIHPSLKVLYMSGYTDDTVVRHGVGDEGVAFLQKPFTPSVLTRKVYEVLGR